MGGSWIYSNMLTFELVRHQSNIASALVATLIMLNEIDKYGGMKLTCSASLCIVFLYVVKAVRIKNAEISCFYFDANNNVVFYKLGILAQSVKKTI